MSCNKTAFHRVALVPKLSTEQKAPFLSSPEVEEIFLPKLAKSLQADVFIWYKVLTAMGAERPLCTNRGQNLVLILICP